jgi:lipopolysaccharide biosynthesis protein
MMIQKPFPYNVLDADQDNIQVSINLLTEHDIIELYERTVPQMFASLLPAVQKSAPKGYFPFARQTPGGEIPAYDFILRMFMLQSAHEQFIFALGHLFRGHASEVGGHLRRASESAGIAYLSKSKPELGDIFMSGDEKKLRKATAAQTILPPNDPLTADLLKSMNVASKLTHNNFMTFASRVETSLTIKDDKWTATVDLDLYGKLSLGSFLRLSLWMLRVIERVLRVLAASFELLESSEWGSDLDQLKRRLDMLYINLDHIVNPDREDQPSL